MRVVCVRIGGANLNDSHQAALTAIARGDAEGLRAAIVADIRDGMGLIAHAGFASDDLGVTL